MTTNAEAEQKRQEYIRIGRKVVEKSYGKCIGITMRKLSGKDLLGLQAYLDNMEDLTMENGGNPREYFRKMFDKERKYRAYYHKKKVEHAVTFLLGILFGFLTALLVFVI